MFCGAAAAAKSDTLPDLAGSAKGRATKQMAAILATTALRRPPSPCLGTGHTRAPNQRGELNRDVGGAVEEGREASRHHASNGPPAALSALYAVMAYDTIRHPAPSRDVPSLSDETRGDHLGTTGHAAMRSHRSFAPARR